MATAYVDVEGREDRLPLVLKGHAVGPIAVFTYDALEVGDVHTARGTRTEVESEPRRGCRRKLPRPRRIPGCHSGGGLFVRAVRGGHTRGDPDRDRDAVLSDTLGEFDESFSEWEIMDGEIPTTLDFGARKSCRPCVYG